MAKKNTQNNRQQASYQLTINPVRMVTNDIARWKLAIDQARDPNFPRRRLLYELYDQIILDGHLSSVIEKRKLSLLNKRVHYNEKSANGEVNPNMEVTDSIIDTTWFRDLMEYSLDADNYGHSLCEFIIEGGAINKVELINRANVIPEIGALCWNYYTMPAISINGRAFRDNLPVVFSENVGVFYRDNKQHSSYLVEFGKAKSYGRLMVAAQYVILKRNGLGQWAQFCEIFGQPFRVGEYDPYDATARKLLEDGLDNMGAAGWAVIPKGANLNFHDHNGSGKSEVFKDLIEACNGELSKIFLGNTMTTEDGSSLSQSKTHKEAEDELKVSDMIKAEQTLNFIIKPKLQELTGINFDKGKFSYPQTSEIPLEQRILIDSRLTELIPISEEYFYATYGVDKPKPGEIPVRASQRLSLPPDDEENKDESKKSNGDEEKKPDEEVADGSDDSEKKKTKLTHKLTALYGHAVKHSSGSKLLLTAGDKKKLDDIFERIIKAMHEGRLRKNYVDPELVTFIREKLMDAVEQGYGGSLASYGDGTTDKAMLENLAKDVKVFSGFKAFQELREATDLLTDSLGNIRPFSEFKNDVLQVNAKYNEHWLETEYNYAIASAQMAANWVDYQESKSIVPNLTYRTAGDDRVREEHARLDGISRPVDDAFWDTYYPPNDWGCRCDVDQTDEEVTDISNMDLKQPPEMFSVNTAKQGVVFPQKHPYYETNKSERKAIREQLDDMED
jgi:SPP1 gp7 family putative phage head morphogenesis protein